MNQVLADHLGQDAPSIAARLSAVLIGLGLAGIVSSRVALAVPLVLATLCYLPMAERQACWARAVEAAKSVYGIITFVIVASWLPNIFASPDPLTSLETALRSGLFIGLSTLLWSVIANDERLYSLALRSFFGALAILLSLALFGYFVLPEVYGLIRGFGWTALHTKGVLKAAASAIVLFIPLLVFGSALYTRWWRVILLALVIGCITLIWITESRSALAGLISGIGAAVFLYVLFRVPRSAIFPWIVIFLGLMVGIIFGLSKTLPVNLPGQDKHVNVEELMFPVSLVDWHRQTIWKYVWSQGVDHRLFGTGVNAINKLPGSNKKIGESNSYFIPLHPHSWLVEVSVETGIIGALTLILGIFIFIYRQVRTFRATGDGAVLAVICLWAAYWAAGLFNFSFWSAWWQVCFLVSTGICLAGRGKVFLPRFTQQKKFSSRKPVER